MRLHFENVLPYREELRNLRPGIIGHHSSFGGVETLHSGIAPHDYCFLGPQKPHILQGGPKIKPTTGAMVTLSFRI